MNNEQPRSRSNFEMSRREQAFWWRQFLIGKCPTLTWGSFPDPQHRARGSFPALRGRTCRAFNPSTSIFTLVSQRHISRYEALLLLLRTSLFFQYTPGPSPNPRPRSRPRATRPVSSPPRYVQRRLYLARAGNNTSVGVIVGARIYTTPLARYEVCRRSGFGHGPPSRSVPRSAPIFHPCFSILTCYRFGRIHYCTYDCCRTSCQKRGY